MKPENVYTYLEKSSYTKAELEVYDKVQDAIRTHSTYIYDAIEEGKREGEKMRKELAQTIEENKKALDEKDREIAELKKLLQKS